MNEYSIRNNQGLSLIELLVSIAILALAMSGVIGLINLASKYYNHSSREVEIQSNLQSSFAVISNLMVDADCGVSFGSDKVLRIASTSSDYGYLIVFADGKLYLGEAKYTDEAKKSKNGRWTQIASVDSTAINSIKGDINNVLADHVDDFYVDASNYDGGYVKMGMAVTYGSRTANMTQNVFLRNSEGAFINVLGQSETTTSVETVEVSGKKYPQIDISVYHKASKAFVAGKEFYITAKLAVTSGDVDKSKIKVESSTACIKSASVVSYNPTTGDVIIKGTSVAWAPYKDNDHKNEKDLVITIEVDKATVNAGATRLTGLGYRDYRAKS